MPDPAWLTQDAYARGTACPYCGSTDLTPGPLRQIEPCEVARVLACQTCQLSWLAIYELRGYEAAQTQEEALC